MNRLFLGLVLVALSGCDTNREPLADDFGNAVKHNIAVQTINPNANPDLPDANGNGQRNADALDRYKKGKVTPPINPIESNTPTGSAVQTAPATQ